MASKAKVGRAFGKGAKGIALWKGSKWLARKVWPVIERRLAKKNRAFFDKVLKRSRRQPRPA